MASSSPPSLPLPSSPPSLPTPHPPAVHPSWLPSLVVTSKGEHSIFTAQCDGTGFYKQTPFIKSKKVTCILSLCWEWVLEFVKFFFCTYGDDCVAVLLDFPAWSATSIDSQTLHHPAFLGRAPLVMVYFSSYTRWYRFYRILFGLYVCEGYRSVVSLS